MHVFLNFKKDFCIFGLGLTFKSISKVLLTDYLHHLEILSHFMIITMKLRFSFVSFCLTGLDEFFLKFESNLCLIRNDLRNEPFDSNTILVKIFYICTICLCMFACVEFEKNA